MNARYYDPEIGQFISPDTLVPDPGNLFDYNRYAYARLNPMRYTDPTGHCVNATTPNGSDSLDYDNEECWRLANTIANMWDSTNYWSNRFTSKEIFLNHVANNAHNGADFFQAQMEFYLQSDAYRGQQPNLPAAAASTGDPMCGNDTACKAVVQHALQANQKCQEIDCIGIGNDVVGVAATGSVAIACVPGLAACATIAAVAGPIATSSTLFGVGWSIYAWSNDKASNNDLTVTLLNAGAGIITDRLTPGLYEAQTAYSLLQLIYDAAPRK